MSIDNAIILLRIKRKNGTEVFQVTSCQAPENLYWWATCCDKPKIRITGDYDYLGHSCAPEVCINCGDLAPNYEQREKVNPKVAKEYFKGCKKFKTLKEAREESRKIYEQEIYDFGIVEHGLIEVTMKE